MILKFDHISFTCNVSEVEDCLQDFKKYKMVFREMHLINLRIKKGTWNMSKISMTLFC